MHSVRRLILFPGDMPTTVEMTLAVDAELVRTKELFEVPLDTLFFLPLKIR